MKGLEKYILLIGRILIVLIFIVSGFGKIVGFDGTLQYMQAFNVPFATFALAIAIIIEIGGGLSLISGYKAKWGSWTLITYTIIVTLIFHLNLADQTQMIMFLKNIAIIGGLLLISVHGPGKFSLDKR